MKPPGGGGRTQHMHIREVSPTDFWVRILPKMIFLSQNKTEIILMLFLTSNIAEVTFLGPLKEILTSTCIFSGYSMFMCRFLSMK